jgi:hypothetical protein
VEQWQAMLRETGRHIGSPRTASRAEMEGRAMNLPGVVWYSLTSGAVVYARQAPPVDNFRAILNQAHTNTRGAFA